jgi:uncharacterized protein (TIGR00730 family)
MINLTVFCSSKNNIDKVYFDNCKNLINKLDINKINIVYGGGTTGLMGIIRKAYKGKIISSNLIKFIEPNLIDNFIFNNIHDRQKKLIDLGDAFLILPGGCGTHYEFFQILTQNDIGETNKPIFIYNVNNIFDELIKYISNLHEKGFITKDFKKLNLYILNDDTEIANLINNL